MILVVLFLCMSLLLVQFGIELHSLVEILLCQLIPRGIRFMTLFLTMKIPFLQADLVECGTVDLQNLRFSQYGR